MKVDLSAYGKQSEHHEWQHHTKAYNSRETAKRHDIGPCIEEENFSHSKLYGMSCRPTERSTLQLVHLWNEFYFGAHTVVSSGTNRVQSWVSAP